MSEKETGGSAFPLFDGSAQYGGMSLRDWFAGMALQGMISYFGAGTEPGAVAQGCCAMSCYEFADTLLEKRKK